MYHSTTENDHLNDSCRGTRRHSISQLRASRMCTWDPTYVCHMYVQRPACCFDSDEHVRFLGSYGFVT